MRDVPSQLAELLAAPPVPQRAFVWRRSAWLHAMHDLPNVQRVLEELPDAVDRNQVRQVVNTQLENGGVFQAFVSAMVWGYGDKGYGPIRVRWVLTGVKAGARDAPVRQDVADRLKAAADTVRICGPVEGFRYLNNEGHIKHLGGAFFTKWLYFVSAVRSADDPDAAPILDQQVKAWLGTHAATTIDIDRTSDYQSYLAILTNWGDQYGRTPVQVEKAIFGLATGRS